MDDAMALIKHGRPDHFAPELRRARGRRRRHDRGRRGARHGELHAEIHPEIPRVQKIGYLVEYVPVVHADQAYAVHDGLLDDAGLDAVTGLLGERGPGTPTPLARLAPRDTVEL